MQVSGALSAIYFVLDQGHVGKGRGLLEVGVASSQRLQYFLSSVL